MRGRRGRRLRRPGGGRLRRGLARDHGPRGRGRLCGGRRRAGLLGARLLGGRRSGRAAIRRPTIRARACRRRNADSGRGRRLGRRALQPEPRRGRGGRSSAARRPAARAAWSRRSRRVPPSTRRAQRPAAGPRRPGADGARTPGSCELAAARRGRRGRGLGAARPAGAGDSGAGAAARGVRAADCGAAAASRGRLGGDRRRLLHGGLGSGTGAFGGFGASDGDRDAFAPPAGSGDRAAGAGTSGEREVALVLGHAVRGALEDLGRARDVERAARGGRAPLRASGSAGFLGRRHRRQAGGRLSRVAEHELAREVRSGPDRRAEVVAGTGPAGAGGRGRRGLEPPGWRGRAPAEAASGSAWRASRRASRCFGARGAPATARAV